MVDGSNFSVSRNDEVLARIGRRLARRSGHPPYTSRLFMQHFGLRDRCVSECRMRGPDYAGDANDLLSPAIDAVWFNEDCVIVAIRFDVNAMTVNSAVNRRWPASKNCLLINRNSFEFFTERALVTTVR
jgi:hypothetical protein